jgi:hypothetical protein
MVRHQHGKPNVPNSLGVSVLDRLDEITCDLIVYELIDSTASATDRNEVTGFARIDPKGHVMR